MSAIEKAAAVLEALSQEHQLSRIARRSHLSPSTVHRILRELIGVGWARQLEGQNYGLGTRLLGLLAQAPSAADVGRTARPILEALRDRTGHTVHFGLREGDEAVYVDKLDGRRAYQMRSRVGLAIPLHSTAIGKAILAELSDAEVHAIADRTGLPAYTSKTVTDLDDLRSQLQTVRSDGYAVDNEENEEHTQCVGAAVIDHRGVPIGGLSLSWLAFDVDDSLLPMLGRAVLKASQSISAALGSDGLTDNGAQAAQRGA